MAFLAQRLLDFETASGVDLKKAGAYRYAEDPTTEILCLSWGAPGTEPYIWYPWMGSDHPTTKRLLADVLDPTITWIAHNAAFEKSIWRCILEPVFKIPAPADAQWHDTMAVCAMKVLPLKLERAETALGIPHKKDMEGSRLTISLSKPNRKTGMLDRSVATIERVGAYCAQDIRVEDQLHQRIGWLPAGERRVWLLDQEINNRGIRLDLDFIAAAREIVDKASKPLAEEFATLTGGLRMSQRDKVLGWVRGQGVAIPNMTKETLAEMLGGSEDDDDDEQEIDTDALEALPPAVARALRIRQLIGSASIKKLAAMEACVCSDGRAHGLLQYHGAGPGRWAGRLLQPQNFPRGSIKDVDGRSGVEGTLIDEIVAAILTGDPEYVEMLFGPAVEAVVSALRFALIASPGRRLVAGDFAQVEARILLALAGQWDKVAILAAGHSPYPDMGRQIYGREIDKHKDVQEYTISKNSVLGLGFGMGPDKFHSKYAKKQPFEFVQSLVQIYRKDWAPEVPKVWYALERAAASTVHSGNAHEAYGVQYRLEDGWLTARLPSGRKLWYYNPQPTFSPAPWDPLDIRPSFTYQAQKMGRWKTIEAYGASLAENVVQGLARDLLVSAMFRCRGAGLPIVLTVHDEIVAEPLEKDVDEKAFEQIMNDSPDWARELRIPVASEVWSGERYRK